MTLNQHYASSSQGVESRPIMLEFAVLSILISRATMRRRDWTVQMTLGWLPTSVKDSAKFLWSNVSKHTAG